MIEGGTDYLSLNVDPYFQTRQVVFGDPTEGTVNDTTLQRGTTTADRTITLPDASGTVALTSDIVTYSNATTSAAGLMSSTDKTKLDGIETGATADQTKADIDALNIDADTVDGLQASSFLRSDAADTASGNVSFTGEPRFGVSYSDPDSGVQRDAKFGDNGIAVSGGIKTDTITVDGYTLQDSTDRSGLLALTTDLGTWKGIQIQPTTTSKWSIMGDQDDFGLYDDANNEWIMLYNENGSLQLYANGSNAVSVTTSGLKINANDYITYEGSTDNTFETILTVEDPTADRTITLPNATGTVWTSGNDGSGSGLDADLLDGQQGSYYLDYNNLTNTPSAGGGSVALTAGIANFIGR